VDLRLVVLLRQVNILGFPSSTFAPPTWLAWRSGRCKTGIHAVVLGRALP
jgi:hypothetical protein